LESSILNSITKLKKEQQVNLIDMGKCSYIDGVGSCESIDSSGEVVSLSGLDISSLISAPINFEHESKLPSQIVGKILQADKIFNESDCKNDRHRYYWKKCGIPFLYIMGRLFDDKKPSAVEIAALFKDDAEHPNEKPIVGFSVEGARLSEKKGMLVERSIARKITVTVMPCNKLCTAELLPKSISNKSDLDSLFKGEMELFSFEPTYIELMTKKEDLEKDVGSLGGSMIGGSLAMSENKPSISPSLPNQKGWTAKAATLTTKPRPAGYTFKKDEKLEKALTAGSGMAAPSQLVGGAALSKESLERKSQKVNSLAKKEKTNWSERADKAYDGWSDKEKFTGYMKKRMPHLAEGEVKAIGRLLALKGDMDKEKSMSKMYTSSYKKSENLDKTTDIMMASEDVKKTEDTHIHGLPKDHPALGNYKGHTYRRVKPPTKTDNTWTWAVRSPEGNNSKVSLPASTAGHHEHLHAHIDKLGKKD
jgi:hypothetical protein